MQLLFMHFYAIDYTRIISGLKIYHMYQLSEVPDFSLFIKIDI